MTKPIKSTNNGNLLLLVTMGVRSGLRQFQGRQTAVRRTAFYGTRHDMLASTDVTIA